MKFSLIICTYHRPEPLRKLLLSVKEQSVYPDEILIVDGSKNRQTEKIIQENHFSNLRYFLVAEKDRGLTKQRNYGISKVMDSSEVVCFLDDDTVLENDYFENVLKSFIENNDVVGVGGVAVNENRWQPKKKGVLYPDKRFYEFDGYVYPEGQRNVVRNYLGLQSNLGPGKMPAFSHGRTCGFPLTGKTYEVDLLIGMAMSFKKELFKNIQFSKFFEGYGLYEDADFSLRALSFGKNVMNTKAQLSHYHAPSGRPNQYQYGKMVVRNGWYVWRVKNPNPKGKDGLKWHAITILLTAIRFTNIFTTSKRKEAFTETIGRIVGWWILIFNKPKKMS